MFAERTVRRLSIRAPADAVARRAGFLIEDALRTASLPGDGAELLLLRRLRLPPFTAAASAQQVALRLEAVCRAAIAVDGSVVDDAALAAAPAVRFADALSAHLALTRLLLADRPRRAWCWPLLVHGYRPALGRGAALRLLALSLAALPEAPAALPCWLALLVAGEDAGSAGGAGGAAFLLALQSDDIARLQSACDGARKPPSRVAPARWQALLDWSAARLGPDDVRHRWLLGMAAVCGVDGDRDARRDDGGASQRADEAFADRLVAGHPGGDGGGDQWRAEGDAFDPPSPAARRAAPAASPSARTASDSPPAGEAGASPAPFAVAQEAGADSEGPCASAAGRLPAAGCLPDAGKVVVASESAAARSQAVAPAAGNELPAPPADAFPPAIDHRAAPRRMDAATAAGGLLFLVPLLTRLGVADAIGEDARPNDLPQRIFATLLRRLPIADDDPLWLLCALPLEADSEADGEVARWLGRCRRLLRRDVGIGLYSLVCRPARIAITATHVDVWQAIDAVDLRVRRAGLDIDPGWVPWLGRVLRFHYGRDDP